MSGNSPTGNGGSKPRQFPSNLSIMKTWQFWLLLGLIGVLSGVAYSDHARLCLQARDLELRLQKLEAASLNREPPGVGVINERLQGLDEQVKRLELATNSRSEPLQINRAGAELISLEQRVRILEGALKPHLEYLQAKPQSY